MQQVKWPDLKKVYKIQNANKTKVITDVGFNKPKMGQINREKLSPFFILGQTNKVFIGTDIQTNEICLGISSGGDRFCKIKHQQNIFCPLQGEMNLRQYEDLRTSGEHNLGPACLITSFRKISTNEKLIFNNQPLMFLTKSKTNTIRDNLKLNEEKIGAGQLVSIRVVIDNFCHQQ